MIWERFAKGTRLWRSLILADVLLYFLSAVGAGAAAASGSMAIVVCAALGLFVTSVLRIVVGQHWRNGPEAFRSPANAYFTLAICSVLASIGSAVGNAMEGGSILDLINMGLSIGMIFVALNLQKQGAKAASPVHTDSLSGLTTFLAVLIPVGLVLSFTVPGVIFFAGLAYLLWLNRLTKLLKPLAEAYAGRNNVAATFE
jgi:hypothetical protein